VNPQDPETIALAIAIADESAVADLESLGHYTDTNGKWFDIGSLEGYEVDIIARSVHYLERRGLLDRQPDQSNLVRARFTDSQV
jgi:hypothetical protein